MKCVKTVVYAAVLSVLLVMMAGCALCRKCETGAPGLPGTGGPPDQRVPDRLIRQYEKDLTKLTSSVKKLKKSNSMLTAENTDLKRENAKYKSLLDLQDRVIELLDDKNNTVRTMLTEEAMKLNLPVNHSENERTYFSFSESDLFDPGSAEINAGGQRILAELCRELESNQLESLVIENRPCDTAGGSSGFLSSECALSAARATAVAKFLSAAVNPAAGLVSSGTAISLHPDLPDADPGKDAERRIDIVLELMP